MTDAPAERAVAEAREEADLALDIVFVRWGEWHLVERTPLAHTQEDARLNVAKAEEALLAARHRLEEAERRLQHPGK